MIKLYYDNGKRKTFIKGEKEKQTEIWQYEIGQIFCDYINKAQGEYSSFLKNNCFDEKEICYFIEFLTSDKKQLDSYKLIIEEEIEVINGKVYRTYSGIENISIIMKIEFLRMLELGIKIRKCAVCGKYFIVTGHDGKCCDSLYKNTGLTCQQVFADRNYKNKRKENPIIKEYDKAYKRMYARYSSQKLSSKEYEEWKNGASQERDKALKAYEENPSKEKIDSFKKIIGNK